MIIAILEKNQGSKDYMQEHKDFKIQDKTVLTKESIVAGQNGQNFREVYQGLDLQDNRYLKVDLMNSTGDRGLIAVVDFQKRIALKAYELILLKAGSINGQTSS